MFQGFFLILNFIIRDEKSFHLPKKKSKDVLNTFRRNIYSSSLPVGMYFIILSSLSTKWKQMEKQLNLFHLLQGLTNKTEQKAKSTWIFFPTFQI